ncbi:hypothetical protein EDB85DRAFT_2153982 [Lactarius pseudohatsudake]|nr:hypothetical protein EDB85DRAFT_2153982 [Lactarius pseudohatsudake]
MADRDVSYKETTRQTSSLAFSPYLRATGQSSPYSARATLPTMAQYLGYEGTPSQPSPTRTVPEHGMLAVLRRYSRFFDSGPRVLHVANTGLVRAFLGHRMSSATTHRARRPGSPAISSSSHRVDVEELVDEGVSSSCGSLDAFSVETCSVEVSEAVRAVGAWIREQDGPAPEGRLWPQDPALDFDFPRKYEEDDFGLG